MTTSTLRCVKCGAGVVKKEQNGISPHPGYQCIDCGQEMTPLSMKLIYVGMAFLCVGFGIAAVFGAITEKIWHLLWLPMLGRVLWFICKSLSQPRSHYERNADYDVTG